MEIRGLKTELGQENELRADEERGDGAAEADFFESFDFGKELIEPDNILIEQKAFPFPFDGFDDELPEQNRLLSISTIRVEEFMFLSSCS